MAISSRSMSYARQLVCDKAVQTFLSLRATTAVALLPEYSLHTYDGQVSRKRLLRSLYEFGSCLYTRHADLSPARRQALVLPSLISTAHPCPNPRLVPPSTARDAALQQIDAPVQRFRASCCFYADCHVRQSFLFTQPTCWHLCLTILPRERINTFLRRWRRVWALYSPRLSQMVALLLQLTSELRNAEASLADIMHHTLLN